MKNFKPDDLLGILMIAIVITTVWLAFYNTERFNEQCRNAGGRPLAGRGLVCIEKNAVIEIHKEQK